MNDYQKLAHKSDEALIEISVTSDNKTRAEMARQILEFRHYKATKRVHWVMAALTGVIVLTAALDLILRCF